MKKHTSKHPAPIRRRAAPRRPRTKAASTSFGSAPSMQAAAARMTLRYETVKAAKNAGCTAFNQNGTVNCDKLAAWLASHPEIIQLFERIPNIAEEEAFLMQANRRTKDVALHRTIGSLMLYNNATRALAAIAKVVSGRASNLLDRLHLKFGIPKEELKPEIDAICKPLAPEESEKLILEISRNTK